MESGCQVGEGGGGGGRECGISVSWGRVSIWEVDEVLEMPGGEDYAAMWHVSNALELDT